MTMLQYRETADLSEGLETAFITSLRRNAAATKWNAAGGELRKLGGQFRSVRTSLGLTLDDMYFKVDGVTASILQEWERGRGELTWAQIQALARHYQAVLLSRAADVLRVAVPAVAVRRAKSTSGGAAKAQVISIAVRVGSCSAAEWPTFAGKADRKLASVSRLEWRDIFCGAIRLSGVRASSIARALGTNDVAVSRWRTGTRVPVPETRRLLAKLLGDTRLMVEVRR